MRFNKRIILSFALLLVVSTGVAGMLGIGKTCVFSSVKARLLVDGKPVANKKVIRKWNWNNPESDESMTDDNGYVSFPSVFESSVSRLLPIEISISQSLSVEVNGEVKDFWISSKREAEENSEYGGSNIDITCELTGEETLIKDYGISKILTVCQLNKES